jgi:hypothetical protein
MWEKDVRNSPLYDRPMHVKPSSYSTRNAVKMMINRPANKRFEICDLEMLRMMINRPANERIETRDLFKRKCCECRFT